MISKSTELLPQLGADVNFITNATGVNRTAFSMALGTQNLDLVQFCC